MKSLTKLKILCGVILSFMLFSFTTSFSDWDNDPIGWMDCQNGGIWISEYTGFGTDPLTDGYCVCSKGWTGKRCEEIDRLAGTPLPCDMGTFRWFNEFDHTWGGVCDCYEGWTGMLCDRRSDPGPDPVDCGDHGRWTWSQGGYCICDAGWTGPLCDKQI